MCKFPLTGCLQIICKNFFAKLVQSVSLCHRLSKKLKVGRNKDLVCYRKNSHSGSVPEDSGSQYKSSVLGLQGGLWVFRKSQKISTASDQYFLSYVKKTTGGGGKLTLPPSRNRINNLIQTKECHFPIPQCLRGISLQVE